MKSNQPVATSEASNRRSKVESMRATGMLCIIWLTVLSMAFPRSSDAEPLGFLPLSVGNTWTYSRNVKKTVLYLVTYQNSDGPGQIAARDCTPGIYSQSLTVSGEANLPKAPPAWGIKVDSKGCEGHYHEAQEVYWFLEPASLTGAAVMASEQIRYDLEYLKSKPSDPLSTHTHDLVAIWEALDGKGEARRLLSPYSVQWYHSNSPLQVSTAAGQFNNCVKVVEDIVLKETELKVGRDDPFGTGWVTDRYFCPKVGLVRESQAERKSGEVTYTLELTSYQVNEQ